MGVGGGGEEGGFSCNFSVSTVQCMYQQATSISFIIFFLENV